MTKDFDKDRQHNCNKRLINQKAWLKRMFCATLPDNISTKTCAVSLCVRRMHQNIRRVIC